MDQGFLSKGGRHAGRAADAEMSQFVGRNNNPNT